MNRIYRLTMIDDDRNFLQILSLCLKEYFQVITFHDHEEALNYLNKNPTDAVLLDLHVGSHDGFSICDQIKALSSQLPVFFLSSDANVASIREGLERGAIDYLIKSTPLAEMKVRIHQRLRSLAGLSKSRLEAGNIHLNPKDHSVFVAGEAVKLSPKEYEILKYFMTNQNKILTKQELQKNIWRGVHVEQNSVDTYIYNLRRKLKAATRTIETKKGQGYVL